MALELNKLSRQVDAMGQTMAQRHGEHQELIEEARARLAAHTEVGEELRQKIGRAHSSDQSWRGADPLGERLDECHAPASQPQPATLIASDGSQIYPDRHGIATYYLLNTGSIVLRQGSGQAPSVSTNPTIFYEEKDLYDEADHLRNPEYINRQRDHREMETLIELVECERTALGGDLSRLILALGDGPLLPWAPQRGQNESLAAEVTYLTARLDRMRRARGVPLGYVDRPNSAYVLRTLELVDLEMEQISQATVRRGKYRRLTDRLLFDYLEPNQRTGLFASTSEINELYCEKGHRITFFYLNVARRPGAKNAIIARVELPEWATGDGPTLDLIQQAVYTDCALTGFPYVLARAHELAVVGTAERVHFESMLQQSMLRCGLRPMTSAKAEQKRLTGSKRR